MLVELADIKDENPEVVLERLRKKVFGDSSLLLDSVTAEELIAMQKIIFKDEAEIVSSAGKPYLMAKSERTIIS